MAPPDDALQQHAARSDAPHRAHLVRTIAQMLSSEAAFGELWDRCAPLMVELAGGRRITVILRESACDRVVYATGLDGPLLVAPTDDLAYRVLGAGELVSEAVRGETTLGVPIRFGRETLGAIVVEGIGPDDLVNAPLLESCALYAAARLHHESTLESTQRFARLALVDGLTGIANRRKFDDTFPREWARSARDGSSLALLMMDVDYFKAFNDSYGHQAGDLCLQTIARTLGDCLQRPADLFARYGGEEFIALLPSVDLAGATALAERMRERLAALAITHEGSSLGHVTLSIGAVAEVPNTGASPEALLRAADEALYRAKAGGRNRVAADDYLSAGPPAERTGAGTPTNLPLATTKLVGRRDELATLAQMLGDNRLVTISGAGGTGKTRVALHVAEDVAPAFPDGSWLVDLSAIRDGALVAGAIGELFGAQIPAGWKGPDALARALHTKHALLVLDNCEQVVDAVAACVSAVLHACPSIRFLATSREPLGVSGEALYRLPPLTEDDAVALFAERARAARRSFTLTAENAPRVTDIVRRLDGVALAIELAAARLGTMGLEALAERLDERFRILTTAERDAAPRHKTMRATLDWSYELLEPNEQRLFRRLGVFAGPFTIAAAAAICVGDGIDAHDVLDLLSGLVRKSLLVDEAGGADDRYVLLESMREYARERAIAAGEDERVAARHAGYFLALAEDAVERQYTAPSREWYADAGRNVYNIRAAVEWALLRRRDVGVGARLAAAAAVFLADIAAAECVRWLDAALEALQQAPSPTLEAQCWLRRSSATLVLPAPALREAAERAVALYRRLDDSAGLAAALRLLAQTLGWYYRDEQALADALACESLAIARALDNPFAIAEALKLRGLTIATTDFPAKRATLEEALALFRLYANDRYIGHCLTWISELEFSAGDERRALDYGRDAVRMAEASGGRALRENSATNLATYASAAGDWTTARRVASDALRMAVEGRSMTYITWAVQALAITKAATGDPRGGARLLGFCDARSGSLHVPRQADQSEAIAYERALERLRGQLPADELGAAMAEGARLSEEDAVSEALTFL